MEDWLVYMIIGTAIFACASIVLGVYGWKLSKKFPHIVKAKVLRIETLYDGKLRYHFECRNNGRYIASDVANYKDKKWKVGEKTNVRLSASGDECHSDFPIWPTATSIVCIIIAMIISLAYFAEMRNTQLPEEAEGSLYQETGYFVATDTDMFFHGDNMGLTKLERPETHISTGDYGSVFFIGTPEPEEGDIIPIVTSLGSNVTKDGTVDDLPEELADLLESLGYVINLDVTDSASLIESEIEEHEHDHSHDELDESIPEEAEISNSTDSNENATEPTED